MREAHAALRSIGLHLLDTDSLAANALDLALTHRHSVYDCAYLAPAVAEDASLVTADSRLRETALSLGIEVIWIDSRV
jgi:predicted nucleic acid-binding protein